MKKTPVLNGDVLLLYVNRLGTGNLYQNTEPLGLKALAAFIEEKGYSSYVFSGPVNEAVKILSRAGNKKPFDAVGLYCDFETVSSVESFSRFVKENTSARVFIGGPQAVALGEDFLKSSRCDAVVRGEGEYPLLELLEFFLRGRGKLEDIAGASYFDRDGNFIKIPPRPPIDKLDLLPLRKSGIDGLFHKNSRNFSILTGRGCPFRCAFCYEGSVSGGVRLRSVENSLVEIKQELEYNPLIRYIWFADDTFTLNPARMEAFSKGLSKLRKDYDFVWFCECHPRTIIKWPDTLSMMIEAGLVRMQIGMESGDAGIIDLYNKQTALEDIEALTRLAYKIGLPQLTGNMIIGGAAESKTTFNRTAAFAKKLIDIGPGMTDITSTFYIPLPETAITKEPKKYGLKILDPASITSIGDMAVVETKKLSRDQIVTMRRDFTRKILQKMINTYKNGLIPVKRIINEFKINMKYGLESNWYKVVFSNDRFTYNFYKKLAENRFIFTGGMTHKSFIRLYPQCSMDIFEMIDITDEYPLIGKNALSPLEYDLLSLCRGDLMLDAIINKTFDKYRKNYSSKDEFRSMALNLMKAFEQNLWIGYSIAPYNNIIELEHASMPFNSNNDINYNNHINDGNRCINIKPDKVKINGHKRIKTDELKILSKSGAARAVIEMSACDELEKYRTVIETFHGAGTNIITGRIAPKTFHSSAESVIKNASNALLLIDMYPGIFEAYYDDTFLKNDEFNDQTGCEEHLIAAQKIKSDILNKMSKLSASKLINYESILSHFSLYEDHGITSIYYDKIFSADPIIYNYFTIISRGGAQRHIDKNYNESLSLRPQRTMAIWMAIDLEKGYPAFRNYVLSPLEYELLIYCTAKSTLDEIYKILYKKFQNCFNDINDLKNAVNHILSDFENKYWILFSKL